VRWTQVTGVAVLFAVLPGCAIWVGSRSPAVSSYASSERPSESYYCYDCHGNRYLDPYYDWCVGYGFRYAWDRHPETVRVYRERYVRIKEQNPSYGRYRYRAAYREQRRYREPQDYDSWRTGAESGKPSAPGDLKVREKTRQEPGSKNKKTKRRDETDRKRLPAGKPRNARPAGGQRPGPPGGA
jgi:hypothetical protein